jgi:hypothetical protein
MVSNGANKIGIPGQWKDASTGAGKKKKSE